MNRLLPLLVLSLLLSLPAIAGAADIVALCIGNDSYAKPEDRLDTPVADATLMKRTLEALPGGADVVLLTDADREGIVIAMNSLVQRARGAKLVLVYYSGHGLEGQPDGYSRTDTEFGENVGCTGSFSTVIKLVAIHTSSAAVFLGCANRNRVT